MYEYSERLIKLPSGFLRVPREIHVHLSGSWQVVRYLNVAEVPRGIACPSLARPQASIFDNIIQVPWILQN